MTKAYLYLHVWLWREEEDVDRIESNADARVYMRGSLIRTAGVIDRLSRVLASLTVCWRYFRGNE